MSTTPFQHFTQGAVTGLVLGLASVLLATLWGAAQLGRSPQAGQHHVGYRAFSLLTLSKQITPTGTHAVFTLERSLIVYLGGCALVGGIASNLASRPFRRIRKHI